MGDERADGGRGPDPSFTHRHTAAPTTSPLTSALSVGRRSAAWSSGRSDHPCAAKRWRRYELCVTTAISRSGRAASHATSATPRAEQLLEGSRVCKWICQRGGTCGGGYVGCQSYSCTEVNRGYSAATSMALVARGCWSSDHGVSNARAPADAERGFQYQLSASPQSTPCLPRTGSRPSQSRCGRRSGQRLVPSRR